MSDVQKSTEDKPKPCGAFCVECGWEGSPAEVRDRCPGCRRLLTITTKEGG